MTLLYSAWPSRGFQTASGLQQQQQRQQWQQLQQPANTSHKKHRARTHTNTYTDTSTQTESVNNTQTPALQLCLLTAARPPQEFIWGKDMLCYATEYRFSTLGPVPTSCSKDQDLALCSLGWQLFLAGRGGQIRYTDRNRGEIVTGKKGKGTQACQKKTSEKREKKERKKEDMRLCRPMILLSVFLKSHVPNYSMPFSPALEIRSQLFSLLFDLRVHKPPSVNVPPPTPKTGKDFPSNINPINAY